MRILLVGALGAVGRRLTPALVAAGHDVVGTAASGRGVAALALHGPGTGFDRGGEIVKAVRRRRLPIVGSGAGIWSFLHVEDAASAAVAALQVEQSSVLNVVDDEPAPVGLWLPYLAAILDANPPMRVPALLGRLFIGSPGVMMMTSARGSSNARIKSLLGWRPRYAS